MCTQWQEEKKIPPFFTDPERKRKTKVTCSKKKKRKDRPPSVQKDI
jgi:hypothetical protein